MQKLIKPFGFLLIMIIFASGMVRVLSGKETLSDYAAKNPEIAYATPQKQPAESTAPNDEADVHTHGMSGATTSPEASSAPTSVSASEVSSAANTLSADTTSNTSDQTDHQLVMPSDTIYYTDDFYYHSLTDEVIARITGISYPVSESIAPALAISASNVVSDDSAANLGISYDDLCYMNVLHYDFNGKVQTGELICNKKIADDLIEIFHELYVNEYQIEKIRLVDEYSGDDIASMLDNNTSCFNYRVVDGTSSLSKHAIGCAIDINPFYNPYVVFNKNGSGEAHISPEGSEIYADRSQNFPYKIDENDLCYKLFKEHGFTWGGDWNSCKDYQHFQKAIK